jgi:MFS family permease
VSTLGVGGYLTSKLNLDRVAIVTLLALAAPASAFALTQTRSLAAVIAAQTVLALLLAIISIRAGKLLHDAVPSQVRAGVSSGVGTLSWVLFLPFSLGFGWFARIHGVRQAGWFLTAAALLIALLLLASAFRRRPKARPTKDLAAGADEIACQELVELVTDYLDGVLPPDLKDKVRYHLDGCEGCSQYVAQIGLTIRALERAKLQLTPRPHPRAPDR